MSWAKWYVLLELLVTRSGERTVDIRVFSEPQPTQPHHKGRALYGVIAGPLDTPEEAEAERRRAAQWINFS